MATYKKHQYLTTEASVVSTHIGICFLIALTSIFIGKYCMLVMAIWLSFVMYKVATID
jgi:hypothetical protein